MSFESTINYGNWVVDAFIAPGASFEQEAWNTVGFYVEDPITGYWLSGDYTFDAYGVVQEYFILGRSRGESFSLAAGIELNGGVMDFMDHVYTFSVHTSDPAFQEYMALSNEQSYGQGLANVIDTFPGANPYDPVSTGVKSGLYGEFYFA